MTKVPTLGFICPDCHHGMTPVCQACEERRQTEANEAWVNQHQRDDDGRREDREERRTIPGVTELEDWFETEVKVEQDYDEDGPGDWSASIRLPGFEVDSGSGKSADAAVAALRVEIAKELRTTANHMEFTDDEARWCLSLSDAQVRALLRTVRKHTDEPEIAALAALLAKQTNGVPDEPNT